jgi:DNA gyrase subunit A
VNLINTQKDEKVQAFVTVREFDDSHFIVMATSSGTIKKTMLSAYGNPRSSGIIAINLAGNDRLIDAQITDGSNDVLIATRKGQAIRFPEADVRDMGRSATGVRGINLNDEDEVVGMIIARSNKNVLVVSEQGYGKRSEISQYRITRRGGKGVITMNVTDKTGRVVAIKEVTDDDDIVIIAEKGRLLRLSVKSMRVLSRNTQGVRLINLKQGDSVIDVSRVAASEELDQIEDEE